VEVLLVLGPFLFYATAPSFDKLKFSAKFRWAQQPRLERRPAAQFLGPDVNTVKLTGTIYPDALGGGDLLPNMQAAAGGGVPFPLIAVSDSSLQGDVMGLWVIKEIDSVREFWGRNGARKISFDIGLETYGPDGGGFAGGLF